MFVIGEMEKCLLPVLTSVHDKQVNFMDEIYVFRHSFVGQMEWSIITGCPYKCNTKKYVSLIKEALLMHS